MSVIKLKEANFLNPVKLDRETSHHLWNIQVSSGTEMHLDFGGVVPKLLLSRGDLVLRYIPYHCVSSFSTEEEIKLSNITPDTPRPKPKTKSK